MSEPDGIARKVQSLRKYEADPQAYQAAPGVPGMDLLSPFGPVIARTPVPAVLVDRLNAFGDTAPAQGETIVPGLLVDADGPASLRSLLEQAIGRYAELTEHVAARRVDLDVVWIVKQGAGTPSPMHFHSCDVSGVLYLKVPPGVSDETELRKNYILGRQAGYINFVIGGRQRFSRSVVSFPPELGVLYLFPGWLLHGAEPFRGPGERRSLSFNAVVHGS